MKISLDRPIHRFFQSWERHPTALWSFSVLWLVGIGFVAFFLKLGSIGLVDETEPLFAEASRQMTVTGDWITPYFNEETRFDKPPLVYWFQAIAYTVLGVNEWAVRLPSAIAAFGLMAFGFYVLRRFGYPNPRLGKEEAADATAAPLYTRPLWLSAWIGSALIALAPETIAWARVGVSDMLLSGCMGTALLAFFVGYAQPERPQVQRGWFLAFYLLIALAVLTKGPVGIVLPGLIVLAFVAYMGTWRVLREMGLIWGLPLVLGLVLPWYIAVIAANGEAYIDSFFGYHNLERFTSVVNNHSAPWYFYFIVVGWGFAPWSIFLPVAIARLRFWKRSQWVLQPRHTHLGMFALFWFAGIFGFFTIAVTKLPSYVLPLMPAAAILVGLLWSERMIAPPVSASRDAAGDSEPAPQSGHRWGFLVSAWLNILVMGLLAGGLGYGQTVVDQIKDPAMPNFPILLQRSGLVTLGCGLWAIAALVGIFLLWRRQGRWLWSVNLAGLVLFILLVLLPVATLFDTERQQPLRQLSETVVQLRQPNEELVMVGFKKPSVVFYTRSPVKYFARTQSALEYLAQTAATPGSSDTVLVLAYPERMRQLGLRVGDYQELDRAGAYQLGRVPKSRFRS